MNCYRMVEAYVIHRDDRGGPVAWISALAPWHHVFKGTLYATQEMLGDAAAVGYRWHGFGSVLIPATALDLPHIRALGPQLEDHCTTMRAPHCEHE